MNDEGYEFVPLPEHVRRAARPEAVHDRRVEGTLTAKVTFTLIAEQPVHVGSGFKTMANGHVARAAISSSGAPCVPGSTLKGVLRSRFEAITRSCALFRENDRLVSVRSSSFPKAKAHFTRSVADRDLFKACGEAGGSCAACALFGRMSLRGRVTVSDFIPAASISLEIAEVAEMFSPNLHHVGPFAPKQGDRGDTILEVRGLHGRKFARGRGPEMQRRERIEVIPEGSALVGELRVVNVTDAEFGGLMAALGVLPASKLKVGAGKGHGFGRMRAEGLSARRHPGGAPIAEELSRFEGAFRASPDAWIEGLDALVHIHDGRRSP